MTVGRAVWALILAGTLLRLALGLSTFGVAFDVEAFGLVRDALQGPEPLQAYGESDRWPYPPGYFPWILLADLLDGLAGLSFTDLVQIPPILADAGIAWLVQWYLGQRGHGPRARVAATALVAFGPVFFAVSGYHGQIDSLAILPALAGLVVWERMPGSRRAVAAGLLIGVGACIKTVPLLVVLALLPWARSPREAVTLVVSAAALPVLAFVPFALADPDGVATALRYRGVPGVGGISLLVQPNLARTWMNEVPVEGSGLTVALLDLGGPLTVLVILAVGAFLFRHRPPPAVGAALLYLAVWAFGINFFLQYVIWGLPLLLMAGYVREVAAAQALMLPALVLVYLRPWEAELAAWLYVPASLALWAASLAGFVLLARQVGRPRPAPG